MNREEIEQEARIKTECWKEQGNCIQAYLLAAVPREERIKELEKENEIFKKANEIIARQRADRDADISMLENQIEKLEMQLSLKIINCIKYCIKSHLCKQDEDYDKPIISPKFLSDALDQMYIDGFEE